MTEAFREYATATAFAVSLTRPQAVTLWLIGREEEGGMPHISALMRAPFLGTRADTHTVQICRTLRARGLIEHFPERIGTKKPIRTLTEAGWLVLALLRVAGVVPAKGASDV